MALRASKVSMPIPEVRRACETDKPDLIRILKASFLTTWTPMLPDAATQAFLKDDEPAVFTARCWQDFHVADVAGRLVGMLFVVGDKIESVHLDPEEKRKGYGSLLMDKGEQLVADNGFSTASLDVLKDNTNAIAFYEARGYRIVKEFTGRESGDTPVQMYLMERDIGKA